MNVKMGPNFHPVLFFAVVARCFLFIDALRQGKVVQIASSHLKPANHKHEANVKRILSTFSWNNSGFKLTDKHRDSSSDEVK